MRKPAPDCIMIQSILLSYYIIVFDKKIKDCLKAVWLATVQKNTQPGQFRTVYCSAIFRLGTPGYPAARSAAAGT